MAEFARSDLGLVVQRVDDLLDSIWERARWGKDKGWPGETICEGVDVTFKPMAEAWARDGMYSTWRHMLEEDDGVWVRDVF